MTGSHRSRRGNGATKKLKDWIRKDEHVQKKRAQIEQKSKQEASEPVSNMKQTQAREKQERPELTHKVDSCEAKKKKLPAKGSTVGCPKEWRPRAYA